MVVSRTKWLTSAFFVAFIWLQPAFPQEKSRGPGNESAQPNYEVWGIEYRVTDVDKAVDFYTQALGFEKDLEYCILRNGGVRLALTFSDAPPSLNGTARAYLNMRIGDFKIAKEKVIALGGKIVTPTPRRFSLGTSVAIQDPSGNHINLLKIEGEPKSPDSDPEIFNLGLKQLDLVQAEAFYADLGFTPYSRDYLPLVLPLNQKGASMLILHGSAEFPADEGTLNGRIILRPIDSPGNGMNEASKAIAHSVSTGNGMKIIEDPSGNQLLVLGPEGVGVYVKQTQLRTSQRWSPLQMEVLKTVESYTEASHERNLDKYLGFWHSDFLGWHNGDNRPTDKEMRRKGLGKYFDNTESIEYGLNPLDIQIIADGKAAIVHYELRNILKIKSTGEKHYGLSYWTDYLVNKRGNWLLVSDHGGQQSSVAGKQ